jgi:DNA-binding LacI/PurR family transcriptional regulator
MRQSKSGQFVMRTPVLEARVREMAIAKGPDAKLPTYQELSEQLGTSTRTLIDVLNKLESQGVVTRKRGSGIYVSRKLLCKNIWILIDMPLLERAGMSPFWGMLWGKMAKEAQRRSAFKNEEVHFQLIPRKQDVHGLSPDVAKLIDNGQADGLIAIGMPRSICEIPSTFPMVSFAGFGLRHVVIPTVPIIEEATRRLIALGCRRIGYWSDIWEERLDEISALFAEDVRSAAFKSVLSQAGLPYIPETHFMGAVSAADLTRGQEAKPRVPASVREMMEVSEQDQGFQAAMRVFGADGAMRPDGVVIAADVLTTGALEAFGRCGVRPGEDVTIASHSNVGLPLLYGKEDQILMWRVDPDEVVAKLFTQLDRLMAGEEIEEFAMVESRFVN